MAFTRAFTLSGFLKEILPLLHQPMTYIRLLLLYLAVLNWHWLSLPVRKTRSQWPPKAPAPSIYYIHTVHVVKLFHVVHKGAFHFS